MKRSLFSRTALHVGCLLGGFSLTLGLGHPLALANQIISFQDLHNVNECIGRSIACYESLRVDEVELLEQSDEIQYQVMEQPELGPTEFELGFRSLMDWAKEVRVVDSQGRELVKLEAEDADTRLRRTTLDTSYLQGGKLVFVKGRMFGVRARVYEMPLTDERLFAMTGKRVVFVWTQD